MLMQCFYDDKTNFVPQSKVFFSNLKVLYSVAEITFNPENLEFDN